MRVWLDCDGVLTDFQSAYLNLYYALSGQVFTLQDWTTFEAEKAFGKPETHQLVWDIIDCTKGFVKGMAWLKDAEEGLRALRTKHKVGLATSPHHGPLWAPERIQWAYEHGFSRNDVALLSCKHELKGDILVEDRLGAAFEYAKRNPGSYAILMDAPYNKFEDNGNLNLRELPNNVIRCRDWWEILSTIEAIEGVKK